MLTARMAAPGGLLPSCTTVGLLILQSPIGLVTQATTVAPGGIVISNNNNNNYNNINNNNEKTSVNNNVKYMTNNNNNANAVNKNNNNDSEMTTATTTITQAASGAARTAQGTQPQSQPERKKVSYQKPLRPSSARPSSGPAAGAGAAAAAGGVPRVAPKTYGSTPPLKPPKKYREEDTEIQRCKRRLDFARLGLPFHRPNPVSVARRNERERKRVKQINSTFAHLRDHLPPDYCENKNPTKMSKVETLRAAIDYINGLQDVLDDTDAVKAAISAAALAVGQESSSPPPTPTRSPSPAAVYHPGGEATDTVATQAQQVERDNLSLDHGVMMLLQDSMAGGLPESLTGVAMVTSPAAADSGSHVPLATSITPTTTSATTGTGSLVTLPTRAPPADQPLGSVDPHHHHHPTGGCPYSSAQLLDAAALALSLRAAPGFYRTDSGSSLTSPTGSTCSSGTASQASLEHFSYPPGGMEGESLSAEGYPTMGDNGTGSLLSTLPPFGQHQAALCSDLDMETLDFPWL